MAQTGTPTPVDITRKPRVKVSIGAGSGLATCQAMTSRWPVGAFLVSSGIALLSAAGSGCASDSKTAEFNRVCAGDSDCSENQQCRFDAASKRLAIPFNPCVSLTRCTDSSQCGNGSVCRPYVNTPPFPASTCPAMVCQPSCQTTGCPSDEVCGADGLCAFKSCAEPDAPSCSERYRCDPAAATAQLLPMSGSSVVDPANPSREISRGCVRKQCDEDGGFTCREHWTCDPARAMNEGSGCVPEPCRETGHCQDDTFYICEPENDGPRPAGTDFHGCVPRNCGEGRMCQLIQGSTNYSYCDLESDAADAYGCRVRTCDEAPELCPAGFTCDLAANTKNAFGCRMLNCNEPGGMACPAGSSCLPLANGVHACSWGTGAGGSGGANLASGGGAAIASGGVAATGGIAGSSGARAGSTGSGSSGGSAASDPADVGFCVERD